MNIDIKDCFDFFNNSNTTKLNLKTESFTLLLEKSAVNEIVTEDDIKDKEYRSNSINPSIKVVTSPMVGIIHFKNSSGSLYISEGDFVKKGQTIAIIESMKIMNEFPSPFSGIIKKICVNDNEMIEFDQKLMEMENKSDEK